MFSSKRFFECEFAGYTDGIDDSKEFKSVRGQGSYTFVGKFEANEPVRYNIAFNCASACQAASLGCGNKIQIVVTAFVNDVFVKELTHDITIAASLKKKYDEEMQQQWDDYSSDEEEKTRSRKRRRTSSARY